MTCNLQGNLFVMGITLVAIFLLVVLTGYGLYNLIEFYDEKVQRPWSRKALRNPMLAAEQYLMLRGNHVKSSSSLQILDHPPESGTIFINDSAHLKTQSRINALIEWVTRGGHLIVGAGTSAEGTKDLLLSLFNVKKAAVECDCDKENKNEGEDVRIKKFSELLREANKELKKQRNKQTGEQDADMIPESALTKLIFEGVKNPVSVRFSEEVELLHPTLDPAAENKYNGPTPSYWEGNKAGPQFMQFNIGKGLFSVLSNGSIWSSDAIGEYDHAYLLSILAGGGGKNEVLLVYGMQIPSIFAKLLDFAPELLFAGLLWLLIWVVHKARRFGPIREENITIRRSLEEHVNACSELLWRSKKSDILVLNLQSTLFRRIKRNNLGFEALDKAEQIHWISRKCQFSIDEVERALYHAENIDEETFRQIVSLNQKIGNKL